MERRRLKKAAKKAARKSKSKQVSHSPVMDLAAQSHASGDFVKATDYCNQVLDSDPGHPVALHMLGVIALQQGNASEAAEFIRKSLESSPDYAQAHCDLGVAYASLNKPDEAISSYQKALELNPLYAEAHFNLGNTYLDLGKEEEAVDRFRRAVEIKPEYAQAHNNLGKSLHDLGFHEEALTHFRKVLALKPGYVNAHKNFGKVLQDLGRFEEAMTSYRRAIALNPGDAQAYNQLALIAPHDVGDEDMQTMEALLSQTRTDDPRRSDLAFALGKAYEDIGYYERAFGFYEIANTTKRKSFSYSHEDAVRTVDRIKAVFDETLLSSQPGVGPADPTPVFVLGMPRSGTSLVEQILASHASVHGAGELTALNQTIMSSVADDDARYPENMRDTSPDALAHMASTYRAHLRQLAKGALYVVDKMPDNFKYIGMIHLMLPDAKVIHCLRHPMDTCLSIFKKDFSTVHPYAYDQVELGRYYHLYQDLMAHWHNVLPGFIHDISYEELVGEPEQKTRDLISFCGLEWDDACLEFYNTDRPVKTASAQQVRKPIYKNALQFWKHYEKQLQPLRDILE